MTVDVENCLGATDALQRDAKGNRDLLLRTEVAKNKQQYTYGRFLKVFGLKGYTNHQTE